MASGITITQQPSAYMPAYNPQFFTAVSTNIAQPNFTYTIIITDLLNSNTVTYQILPRPDGKCVFDAGVFAENQIRSNNYIPANLYGWQAATGVRQIRVNIGETYGTSPAYTAGSNINYIVWNACLKTQDFPSYAQTNFVYNSGTPNYKYFAGVLNDITFTDRSNYLYALTSVPGDFTILRVKTFDSTSSLLGTSLIANPFATASLYYDKYVCIDVGHKGLANISAGFVSGAFPIITASVASYTIEDMTPASPLLIKTITIGFDIYDIYTIHYLARNGSFQSLNFSLITDSNTTKTVTSYVQNPNSLDASGNTYGYGYSSVRQKQLSVSDQTTLTLRSDYITDEMIDRYQECFDSPICFLDQGSSKGYASVIPVKDTYVNRPHRNKKLVSLQWDFQFDHQNARQRV